METGKPDALRAIVTAWLVVGILDISSAFTIWVYRGVPLTHGLQGLLLPLLGPSTFEGGLGTAGLGLALHFFIAFTVVVLGGMGSFVGALLGGLIIGVVEALSGLFLGESLGQIGIFVIFILVLLFRPTGLLGHRV